MAEKTVHTDDNHYLEKAIYSISTIYFICIALLSEAMGKLEKSLPFNINTSNMVPFIMRFLTEDMISLPHSILDMIILSYVMYKGQLFIGFLVLCVIACNLINFLEVYNIRYGMRILTWHPAGLFHATLQILPLSLSLGYYDSNDAFINVLFIIVSTSFTFMIFVESKKINSQSDNNKRINNIYALCIILDYIHIILLLLCNVYTTNNYFFWKFILQSYPFCFGIQIAVFYVEGRRMFSRVPSRDQVWNAFLFVVFIWFIVPVGAECINASWIILLYLRLFKNLRCGFSESLSCHKMLNLHRHSKQLDESVKDDLVDWLTQDKDDLLLKICCINHIKLYKSGASNNVYKSPLLQYLDEHHRENNKFYQRVTWHGIKSRSDKLKNLNLMKRIGDDIWKFYSLQRLTRDTRQEWNNFKAQRDLYHLQRLLEVSWELGAVACFIGYAIFSFFNVFTSPFIAVLLAFAYGTLNIHQSCFIILYSVIMCITIYKLYVMMNYERMMWYILPDLSQSNCTSNEILKFKAHYKVIKYEFDAIKDELAVIVGNDVANTIMLYVPDYIGTQDLESENESL